MGAVSGISSIHSLLSIDSGSTRFIRESGASIGRLTTRHVNDVLGSSCGAWLADPGNRIVDSFQSWEASSAEKP